MHRKLMVDIKRSRRALQKCKTKAQQKSSKIFGLTGAHGNFLSTIKVGDKSRRPIKEGIQ